MSRGGVRPVDVFYGHHCSVRASTGLRLRYRSVMRFLFVTSEFICDGERLYSYFIRSNCDTLFRCDARDATAPRTATEIGETGATTSGAECRLSLRERVAPPSVPSVDNSPSFRISCRSLVQSSTYSQSVKPYPQSDSSRALLLSDHTHGSHLVSVVRPVLSLARQATAVALRSGLTLTQLSRLNRVREHRC